MSQQTGPAPFAGMIDPAVADGWLREYAVGADDDPDAHRPAFLFGVSAGREGEGRPFADLEPDLRARWEREHAPGGRTWEQARPAVENAYRRTLRLHEERLVVEKEKADAADVIVRKEVVTETRQVSVPVRREEVVIERRAADGEPGEVTRIPVSEERVNVTTESVPLNEVTVERRTRTEAHRVEADVRKEELEVDEG